MIVLLSPSKTINPKAYSDIELTKPKFINEAHVLAKQVLKSKKNISKTLGVSEKLGELNLRRFQDWSISHVESGTCAPAAWAYRGETFFGLSIDKMKSDDQQYAQDHIRIISGLYGLLRPLDLIHPYRLEMSTRLKGRWGKNLYEFWSGALAEDLTDDNDEPVLNCSSVEYSKAVLPYMPDSSKVITARFLAHSPTGLKSKMVFAKYSRGLLARWVVENRVEAFESLKKFDVEGYVHNSDLSSESEIVFVAPKDFTIKGRFTIK